MIREITKEKEQLKIMGHIVDLKPITKASIDKMMELGGSGKASFDEFEEMLKIGIGDEQYNEVFPDAEHTDIEVMIQAALAVYEIFMDKNLSHIEGFKNKYNPNRASRRAANNK